jgi:hypothetical protein
MGNKFKIIYPNLKNISKSCANRAENFLKVFDMHPLERTASIRLAAGGFGGLSLKSVRPKIEAKLGQIFKLADYQARYDALMKLFVEDPNALEVVQEVIGEGYAGVAERPSVVNDEEISAGIKDVISKKYTNFNDIVESIAKMGLNNRTEDGVEIAPFDFMKQKIAGHIFTGADGYYIRGNRDKVRASESPYEKQERAKLTAEWRAELRSQGLSPEEVDREVGIKVHNYLQEKAREGGFINKPSSLNFMGSDEGQELGEFVGDTGMSTEDAAIEAASLDEELKAKLFEIQRRVKEGIGTKEGRKPISLRDLGFLNRELDDILIRYKPTHLEPAPELYQVVRSYQSQIASRIDAAKTKQQYVGQIDTDTLVDLVHTLVGGGSEIKKRRGMEPSEFVDRFQGMRGQSHQLIPYLAKTIKHPESEEFIRDVNLGSQKLKPLFYALLKDPQSADGRIAHFIVRNLLDTIDFNELVTAEGIQISDYVKENPHLLKTKSKATPIDEGVNLDDDLGDDVGDDMGETETLPINQPEAVKELQRRKNPKEEQESEYSAGSLSEEYSMKLFMKMSMDELKSNPELDGLQQQASSIISSISQTDFDGVRAALQIGFPIAIADKIRADLKLSWASISDQEIKQISQQAINSYYRAFPRRIRGYGQVKQKSDFLKQQSVQYKYLIDALVQLRSRASGQNVKTILPDINTYKNVEQQRAAVAMKLMRVATVLDMNNYFEEASLIDKIVEEYVG